jgi:hypothetical protein
MKDEKNALVEKDMWELVDCPKNVKVIHKRWVLQMKLNADGLTKWLCAQQVMKGRAKRQELITTRTSALWPATTQYVLCLQLLHWRGWS